MMEQELYSLKFSISEFTNPETITEQHIQTWLEEINSFPKLLKQTTNNLTNELKSWRYRSNG